MDVVRITVNVGSSASPAELESLVRAIRVASDIGTAATMASVRRAAEARMKTPTDAELVAASERLPRGSEASPSYRAREFLENRRRNVEELMHTPPELWLRNWVMRYENFDPYVRRLASAGLMAVWPGDPMRLDDLDPELYSALVADAVALGAPTPISVRELSYRNPFGEELAAAGKGAEALRKAAGVIETAATLGSRRKIMQVEARIAEQTTVDRIAESHIDRALSEERLRRERIENALAEQQLLAQQIQNARDLAALSEEARVQLLIRTLAAAGKLDEADALAQASHADIIALIGLGSRGPAIEHRHEDDPDPAQGDEGR